jgi:tyrosyl-tRNA synthetase
MPNAFDELAWRGLVQQTTAQNMAEVLSKPIAVYTGFDPTATSLHAGNLVPLMLLTHLRRHGHKVLPLVGGATGMIGDPSGKSSERTLLDQEKVRDNTGKIRAQIQKFFAGADEGAPVQVVDNLDWLGQVRLLDFLRDVGKHFSVNVMLSRESVSARLEGGGISYTEFSYMLLQALDYLELYRRYGCRLQTGGSDQWGNIVAGLDLVRRVEGGSGHALTTPLVTSATGEKFGKSTGGGRLWLDPAMTSPYAFYQYWINVEDASVVKLLKVFTDRTPDEVAVLEQSLAEKPFLREAQKALAADVTTLVHGAAATAAVRAASEALFGRGDVHALDARTLGDATAELPGGEVSAGTSVTDALVAVGLVDSRNAARRVIGEGGASLNNVKLSDAEQLLGEEDFLHGRVALLRRGRKSLAAGRRATP